MVHDVLLKGKQPAKPALFCYANYLSPSSGYINEVGICPWYNKILINIFYLFYYFQLLLALP